MKPSRLVCTRIHTGPRRPYPVQVGPPRKRGRPPRTAAPPAYPHTVHQDPYYVSEATPPSFDTGSDAPQGSFKRSTSADSTPPALVFQCVRCSTVVSDSFSWVTAQRQLSMIVLKETTDKVAVIGPVITSSEPGPALGSTYSVLQCSQCSQHLGRKYHNTPRGIDELQDTFAFHLDAIIVYVGSTHAAINLGRPPLLDSPPMSKPWVELPSHTLRFTTMNGRPICLPRRNRQRSHKARWTKFVPCLWCWAND